MLVNNYIADLIIKHLQETITEDEKYILNEWMGIDEWHRVLFDRLTNNELLHGELIAFGESDQQIKTQVYARLPEVQHAIIGLHKRRWMFYACLVAVILSACACFWNWRPGKTKTTKAVTTSKTPVGTVIPPGGNKATLTLEDGTVICLDKAANGTIAEQDDATASKKEGGRLAFNTTLFRIATGRSTVYNILNTPWGGQFQLLLPDGSKVWLNAASSIKHPVTLMGNDRSVAVSEEAYCEIANDIYTIGYNHFR